jgi:hypothetical protein
MREAGAIQEGISNPERLQVWSLSGYQRRGASQ